MKRPITTIVASIAATIVGFSQTAPTPAFPVQRVLTDTLGRKLDTTILEKSPTAIKCRRNPDGAEFTIELTKLSAEDRKFLAEIDKPKTTVSNPVPAPTGAPIPPAGEQVPPPWAPFDYNLNTNEKVNKMLTDRNTGSMLAYKPGTPDADRHETVEVVICGKINKVLMVTNTQGLDAQGIPYEYLSEKDRKFIEDGTPLPTRNVPFPYTLTFLDGKKLEGAICGKVNTACLFRRKTDKEISVIRLTDITVKDRKVLGGIECQSSLSLPLRIDLTCMDGRKLDVTILKRSGKDKTAFTCKKTDGGKEFDIEFYKFSAETQGLLAQIRTQEPTTFPVFRPMAVKGMTIRFVLENSGTEIKCPSSQADKPITLKIADLDEEDRKFIKAPCITVTGVPRRFKHDITIHPQWLGKPYKLPAGTVVWVDHEANNDIWLYLGGYEMPHDYTPEDRYTAQKVDYEIVISANDSARGSDSELRIPAGTTIYVSKEDATTMTIHGYYITKEDDPNVVAYNRQAGPRWCGRATVTKPPQGTKTVKAVPQHEGEKPMDKYMLLPNLADPPFDKQER